MAIEDPGHIIALYSIEDQASKGCCCCCWALHWLLLLTQPAQPHSCVQDPRLANTWQLISVVCSCFERISVCSEPGAYPRSQAALQVLCKPKLFI